MEVFSALPALCHRPVTRSLDVFFDPRLNKRLSNQDAGDLRRHRANYNVTVMFLKKYINPSTQCSDEFDHWFSHFCNIIGRFAKPIYLENGT